MSEHFLARYNREVVMRNSKFTETQIVAILHEADAGMPVKEVCRKHGISSSTYYKWKAKCGGLSVSELKRRSENPEQIYFPETLRQTTRSEAFRRTVDTIQARLETRRKT